MLIGNSTLQRTIMAARESSKKHAGAGVGKRDTANAPYKPLKMTATQRRRALKKKIMQEPARVSKIAMGTRTHKAESGGNETDDEPRTNSA
jgi:hypothetical protein